MTTAAAITAIWTAVVAIRGTESTREATRNYWRNKFHH